MGQRQGTSRGPRQMGFCGVLRRAPAHSDFATSQKCWVAGEDKSYRRSPTRMAANYIGNLQCGYQVCSAVFRGAPPITDRPASPLQKNFEPGGKNLSDERGQLAPLPGIGGLLDHLDLGRTGVDHRGDLAQADAGTGARRCFPPPPRAGTGACPYDRAGGGWGWRSQNRTTG